ncbi:MAG: hypothetical protein AAFV71_15105 [Cyanobacteria bacterium J06633_8]
MINLALLNLVQVGVNKATIKNGSKAEDIKLLTSYFLLPRSGTRYEFQILREYQKPGFFAILSPDNTAFTTRNRVSLSEVENGAKFELPLCLIIHFRFYLKWALNLSLSITKLNSNTIKLASLFIKNYLKINHQSSFYNN